MRVRMDRFDRVRLYKKFPPNSKKIKKDISRIARKLLGKIKIKEELFEKNSDTEESWFGYTMVIDSKSEDTVILNEEFIDYCIKNNKFDILKSNITFRFESGDL